MPLVARVCTIIKCLFFQPFLILRVLFIVWGCVEDIVVFYQHERVKFMGAPSFPCLREDSVMAEKSSHSRFGLICAAARGLLGKTYGLCGTCHVARVRK